MADDDSGAWKEALAGENTERLEALGEFETPEKFLEHYDGLTNRNWRDEYAGDDDKFKSTLERFATPLDMGKSFREAQQTISANLHQQVPDENADEATVKAYREANNIPLEAKGYLDNLPDGLVVGEEDAEIFTDFMGVMHNLNAPPAYAHAVIDWYNKFAEQQQDDLAELDSEHHQEVEDQLRAQGRWGTDYRANVNLVGALIESSFGKENKDAFLHARDPDGRAIMNIPGVLEGLATIARQLNPITQLTPPGQGDPEQTLNDEIADIEKLMRSDRKAYNEDEKMQARLRQLYEIRTQHQAA